MTRRFCLFLMLAVAVGFSVVAAAQEHEHDLPAQAKSSFDKAVMQKVWDAWGTLDVSNAAKFYNHEPNHTFYDVAPLQYHNWAEYEAGVKPMLSTWKSMKAKVNYDGMIRSESATMTWTASTVDAEVVTKNGKTEKMTFRWTAIWQKHGNDWIIEHEHVSAPMP